MPKDRITVGEAAEQLGVTRERVYALIRDGRLKADKFGRDWAILPRDLEAVKARPPGRPRKTTTKTSKK